MPILISLAALLAFTALGGVVLAVSVIAIDSALAWFQRRRTSH